MPSRDCNLSALNGDAAILHVDPFLMEREVRIKYAANLGCPGLVRRGGETWESTSHLRADSERLLHAMLFFLFLHRPLGVG
jgi:hypothetical protein